LSLELHTENDSLEIKIETCKVLNATAIASGYAGRDPQEEWKLFASSLLSYKKWLKFFF